MVSKNLFPFSSGLPRGMSLIEVLVAIGVFGVVAVAFNQVFKNFIDSSGQIEYEYDLLDMSSKALASTSCNKLLETIKLNNGGSLPAAGTPVDLVRVDGRLLYGEFGPTGSPFALARKVKDNWFAKATWSGSGVSVSVAKSTPQSTFAVNRFTKSSLDFNHPKHQLNGGMLLCSGVANKSYESDVFFTTNSAVAEVLGEPHNTSGMVWMTQPLGLGRVCHRYCESKKYISGWCLGWQGTYWETRHNGNLVQRDFPNDQQPLNCRCIR